MTLHRFWSIAPSHMSNMQDTFRQILCDRDPGVMAASLHIFYDLVNVSQFTLPSCAQCITLVCAAVLFLALLLLLDVL